MLELAANSVSAIQRRPNVRNSAPATDARAHQKASYCYEYYVTVFGKQVVALGLKLKELIIIHSLPQFPLADSNSAIFGKNPTT
jgi:hypothetical protein